MVLKEEEHQHHHKMMVPGGQEALNKADNKPVTEFYKALLLEQEE